MMNQKAVIYIILSAILLYLYYKRGGIGIFVAFVVVVAGTLFVSGSKGAREGFGAGGGKGDNECAKLGFKPPKIDKKDINGSLVKVMKNIKPIADKYWKRDIEAKGDKNDEKFEKSFKALEEALNIFQTKNMNNNINYNSIKEIYYPAVNPYILLITQKKTDDKSIDEYIIKNLDKIIDNTKPALETINLIKKSDEMKKLDKGAKQILNYLVCLAKHWISIYKAIQKAKGGDEEGGDEEGGDEEGGDEEGGDEEEKPKKKKKTTKKKKATKKKKSEDEEDEE